MSDSETTASSALLEPVVAPQRPRRPRLRTSLLAHGEPMIWLTGGALALSLAMIVGLLGLILVEGLATFWPGPLVELRLKDGSVWLGEVASTERFVPSSVTDDTTALAGAEQTRRLLRTGNFDLTGVHFQWIDDADVLEETRPEWAMLVERLDWGRFYGVPRALLVDGQPVAEEPEDVWRQFQTHHEEVRSRWRRRRSLETTAMRRIGNRQEAARLALVRAEQRHGGDSSQVAAAREQFNAIDRATTAEFAQVRAEIHSIDEANDRYELLMRTADGQEKALLLADIVRVSGQSLVDSREMAGIRLALVGVFDQPRSNSEGACFRPFLAPW